MIQSPAFITIYSKEGLEELITYSDATEFLIGRQDLQNAKIAMVRGTLCYSQNKRKIP